MDGRSDVGLCWISMPLKLLARRSSYPPPRFANASRHGVVFPTLTVGQHADQKRPRRTRLHGMSVADANFEVRRPAGRRSVSKHSASVPENGAGRVSSRTRFCSRAPGRRASPQPIPSHGWPLRAAVGRDFPKGIADEISKLSDDQCACRRVPVGAVPLSTRGRPQHADAVVRQGGDDREPRAVRARGRRAIEVPAIDELRFP